MHDEFSGLYSSFSNHLQLSLDQPVFDRFVEELNRKYNVSITL
jgi:hypothetical protein